MDDTKSMYPDTYDSSSPEITVATLVIYAIAIAIGYLLTAIPMAKIFQKANVESWKAWVPIYNSWTFLELGGQKGWYALLALTAVIPFIGFFGSLVSAVFLCIAAYKIGLAFQKEGVWVVLYIFFPVIWLFILAFDSSRFNPAAMQPIQQGGYYNPNQQNYGAPQQGYYSTPVQPQTGYPQAPQADSGNPQQQQGYSSPAAPPSPYNTPSVENPYTDKTDEDHRDSYNDNNSDNQK